MARILVVDDDEAGRYLLESILRASGHEVVTAVDGQDALEQPGLDGFDLIITDVLMPRMDGYKLCLRLKNDPALRAIPIIVYTASFGDPEDKQFALSLGVDSFMLKPQEPTVLMAEIERLLEAGRKGPEAEGPSPDEAGTLREYGERISHKLYQKLLQLEQTNADLNATMRQLAAEIEAKSKLVEELSRAVAKEQAAQSALLVSEERYAAAVRGANDGIWDWDLKSGSFYASPRFRELIGLPEDEPLVSPEQWLSRVVPEDVQRLGLEIDRHIRGLTPFLQSEYQVVTPEGAKRWMLSRGQAVRREDGAAYRMAGSLSDVTERRSQQEEILHNALYDRLTGLPNRTLFMDRVAFLESRRERNEAYLYAVLFVDLDRFKNVNESLGHSSGDILLVEVARRLRGCARTGDTVARFGGDKYVLLLDDLDDPKEADRYADCVQDALRAPFWVDGHGVHTAASIGIAIASKTRSPEELVRDAETAMYRAKEAGRGRVEVFDTLMHAKVLADLQTEEELRHGIERGELEAYYQPVVSLSTGRVVSCEALVRWNHPGRGLLDPDEFVPVAEATGLIVPMGMHVLRAACDRNRAWQKSGRPPIIMSVNISARHFAEPDLLESITTILHETDMAPEYLLLELTESVVMADPERAAVTLDALHRLGVGLALDDFGTGYSSLAYLKRFPFHMLKIDRGFVMDIPRDEDDMSIVEAVIGLAHSLKLQVTAEGVETQEQLGFLRDLGCDNAQGFLVSRAVPSREFEVLLDAESMLPV